MRRSFVSVCLFVFTTIACLQSQQPVLMAGSGTAPKLLWQRTSPTAQQPDGPVLYQIIFRSSAHVGSIPKIGPTYTLMDSGLTVDNGGNIAIGGLAIASDGTITFKSGQTFPLGSAGGDVNGSFSSLKVTGIQKQPVATTIPTTGQVLQFDGSQWAPSAGVWLVGGNTNLGCFSSPCTGYLGTTDGSILDFDVQGQRAYSLEPATSNALGSPLFSPNLIGGSSFNRVLGGGGATIAGGGAGAHYNVVTDDFGTVGGGSGNYAGNNAGTTTDAAWATVAGGQNNTASGTLSTVAGGQSNTASGANSTIAGGSANTASNYSSAVGGGLDNSADGYYSTVGGGSGNHATIDNATVAGGFQNGASGPSSAVAGGISNIASGDGSFVAGGSHNIASGLLSFAAGSHADANNHPGAFVWGDNSTTSSIQAAADNQFVARASGGVVFYTNSGLSTGVQVAAGGGSWSSVSDRNVKDHFASVDAQALLANVISLPITTWNYKTQDTSIRHIGPMAQDFFAAFNVGEDNRHITEIDEGGVALAAIQGLNQKLEQELKQKDQEIELLKSRLEKLETAVAATVGGRK